MPSSQSVPLIAAAAGMPSRAALVRLQGFARPAFACSVCAVAWFALQRAALTHLRVAQLGAWARPGAVCAALGAMLVLLRTWLWLRYEPAPAATFREAPALTVIIPAYNEGAMVARAIESVVAADYPRDRLEILAVDDGSTDDTWAHIAAVAARHRDLVTAIGLARNRGKRAALEVAFREARGDLVVTIDSDSVIERGALLALAGPFRDARVGAVAGKVSVYNRRSGLLPRMLQVRFMMSFDLLRAGQSVYGTVYCCPGALAAYRMSVIRDVLDDWSRQTFLGVTCTYGEDRALTNFILDRGYDTVYQCSAVVHTVVPTTYARLVRMYLRWERSHLREEIRFARILWKRPVGSRVLALVDGLLMNVRYPLGYLASWLLGALSLRDPAMILRIVLLLGVASLFNLLFYLRTKRPADFLYGVLYSYFSTFTLFWLLPYAALTLRSRSWMTR